jgi:hypothetical protein
LARGPELGSQRACGRIAVEVEEGILCVDLRLQDETAGTWSDGSKRLQFLDTSAERVRQNLQVPAENLVAALKIGERFVARVKTLPQPMKPSSTRPAFRVSSAAFAEELIAAGYRCAACRMRASSRCLIAS